MPDPICRPQRVEQLHHFPESGRKVPEDKRGMYRELIVGNYRVVYRMNEDTVTIVTLIHGARMLRL
jgi:plasmid stabilization system protein ParE